MKEKIEAILDSLTLNDNSPEAIWCIMREFKHEDAYGLQANREIIGSPKVIVDLGAHVGTFSILMSKLYPEAQIHAYEPFPDTYFNLCRNIEVNKCTNITAYNLGVSDAPNKTMRLVAPKENSGGASIVFANLESYLAQTTTLNDIVGDKHVDFLKIDVERAEFEILHAFEKWDQLSYLAVEYHKPLPIAGFVDEMQYALVHRFSQYVENRCKEHHVKIHANDIRKLCYG